MKRFPDNWPLLSVYALKGNIDPSPPYQRAPAWTLGQKQLLIDSVLRNIDIPKLYITKSENDQYEWEVVDGQQRLRAVWEFMDGEYKLSDDAYDIGNHSIADKYFDNLHSDIKLKLNAYTLNFIILEEESDHEIEEMFLRLQNGTSLNNAEKRNAIPGNTRDFVRDIAESHRFFTDLVNISPSRYIHHEIVAQMLLIERTGGPTPYTHTQLTRMYKSDEGKSGRPFNKNSAEAKKVKRVLDFLVRAFSDNDMRVPELSRLNVISLYTLASELLENYAILRKYKKFSNWFIDFEVRREAQEPQEDDEMYGYHQAIYQRTGAESAQKTRREVLIKDLLASMPDLALLDKQRQFTEEQRRVIYRRASGECINPNNNSECVKNCTWDNWHADHIIPHSQGGQTTVENGQLLCPSCNLKKSDKMLA